MSEPKTRREIALLATGGLVASALVAYARPAAALQPNMERAKASLIEALHFLEMADSDKGGYRVAAMKACKTAIAEVDAGMRYDATH